MKVVWDEDVCIHSGNCVRGLPNVFQVKDGSFVIDTRAASEEDIRAVVESCPSGALKIESRKASK